MYFRDPLLLKVGVGVYYVELVWHRSRDVSLCCGTKRATAGSLWLFQVAGATQIREMGSVSSVFRYGEDKKRGCRESDVR